MFFSSIKLPNYCYGSPIYFLLNHLLHHLLCFNVTLRDLLKSAVMYKFFKCNGHCYQHLQWVVSCFCPLTEKWLEWPMSYDLCTCQSTIILLFQLQLLVAHYYLQTTGLIKGELHVPW